MGAVVKLPSGDCRLLVKGAFGILLDYCTPHADPEQQTSKLTSSTRKSMEKTITAHVSPPLRRIGLVYRDFPQWPPAEAIFII